MKFHTRRGFTLVELVIVIAVIAVLAAVLIPTFSGVIDNARMAKDNANAKTLTTQMMLLATSDGVSSYTPQEARAYLLQHCGDSLKTNAKGTSFWYDVSTNTVKALKTEEAISQETSDLVAALGGVTASAADAGASIWNLGAHSTLVYIAGDDTLTEVVDTISNLTMRAKLTQGEGQSLGQRMDALFSECISTLNESKLSETVRSKIELMLQAYDPERCIYFDNAGIYHSGEATSFDNYFVTDGTTKIAGLEGETVTLSALVTELVFPAGCTVNARSLKGVQPANASVTVTVPAATSATADCLRQFVGNTLTYAASAAGSAPAADVEANLRANLNAMYDGVDLDEGSGMPDASILTGEIEHSVAQQVSAPSTNDRFVFVTGNQSNAMDYIELEFGYEYIQIELRTENSDGQTVVFRTQNETGTGSTGSVALKGWTEETDKIPLDNIKIYLQDYTTDYVNKTYDTNSAGNTVLSETLIPTLKIDLGVIFDRLEEAGVITGDPEQEWKLGKDDVIELYYENYANYGVLRGACVIYYGEDADDVISFRIRPVMYLKRVSVSTVTMDALAGLNNAILINVPDLSGSVNMDELTVEARTVGSGDLAGELTQLGSAAGANAGKYYYPADQDGITEILVKDNRGEVVFRQIIKTASAGGA